LTAIKIPYRVLQNPLKKHREFRRGLISIFLRKLHHGVLNNVQRMLFVPYGETGLLKCASLDTDEKVRQFGSRSQERILFLSAWSCNAPSGDTHSYWLVCVVMTGFCVRQ
jgi:hypothetical protein